MTKEVDLTREKSNGAVTRGMKEVQRQVYGRKSTPKETNGIYK